MSILKVLIYPNKNLRKKAKLVKNFNKKLKINIFNMFETMYHYNGIGLASTQVNINKSIIVIDLNNKNKKKKLILINPKIIKKKGKIKSKEGCLSIPNYFLSIKRYKYINVEYLNINGKKNKLFSKNLLSICIQHEIDHINGKLFIDYYNNK